MTPWGLYQWIQMPFGLKNAPAEFQRTMENILGEYCDKIVIPYLDDLIVFSKSFEEHLEHLKLVLRRLRKHGVKLKGCKCNFFKHKVKFLGTIVSEHGYQMDPDNIKAAQFLKKKKPKNVGDVRKLVRFVSHFRRYIRNFACIAKLLTDLLQVPSHLKGQEQKSKGGQRVSSEKVNWTDKREDALSTLIDFLTKEPILTFPRFNLPYVLHSDTSQDGLGAILYQYQDGLMRVIGYASRTLTPAKKGYHLHSGKLEFLALKWSITEVFKCYLYHASSFRVLTDNNPLTYVMSTAKLNATGMWWVGELAEYHFDIKYQPGRVSVDVDTLSKMSMDIDEYEAPVLSIFPKKLSLHLLMQFCQM